MPRANCKQWAYQAILAPMGVGIGGLILALTKNRIWLVLLAFSLVWSFSAGLICICIKCRAKGPRRPGECDFMCVIEEDMQIPLVVPQQGYIPIPPPPPPVAQVQPFAPLGAPVAPVALFSPPFVPVAPIPLATGPIAPAQPPALSTAAGPLYTASQLVQHISYTTPTIPPPGPQHIMLDVDSDSGEDEDVKLGAGQSFVTYTN
jgi:hypothetical protein